MFQQSNQFSNTQLSSLQVQQNVHNLLTWTVVSNLTTSVRLDNWDVTWHQDVFSLTSLTLSENWVVFNQPDFVQSRVVSSVSKFVHSLRDWFVWLQTQLSNQDLVLVHF
ncbi:putative octanoyltransferase [Bacillus subtilis MB73/2]|nr:putative octanoyltransferase [Bacillus subtilis MB73/2]